MHQSVEEFVKRVATPDAIRGRRVLEVGSFNVNGSPRDWIEPLSPAAYYGVDLRQQPRYVDERLDAGQLVERFGPESWDVVISTEMLEHTRDWRAAVNGMKGVLKTGGLLILTARGPGFPYHCPPDYWRFTIPDLDRAMCDFVPEVAEADAVPGFLFAGKKAGRALPDLSAIAPGSADPSFHGREAFDLRMAARRTRPIVPEPFTAFYHVACMGNWREVLAEQCNLFDAVGLRPAACVLGTEADASLVAQRIPVIYRGDDLREYETPTLDRLWAWCCVNPDGAALYVHTKGVSNPGDRNKPAWRQLMQEHVIRPWRENLKTLAGCDALGVDWIDSPRYPHFSGNFWMARADWIAHLQCPVEHRRAGGPSFGGQPWERMAAEMWIGSRPFHAVKSLAARNVTLMAGPSVFQLLEETRQASSSRSLSSSDGPRS